MQTVNSEQKLVSVIIPVHNVRSYLKEAINSVLDQTYPFLEIILIDDGSTDGSGQLCDQYVKIDHRIKVVHQKNQGLSAARNAGLNICKGEYIAFLDPDDAFCRNAISKLQAEMYKTDADIVECNYAIYNNVDKMDPSRVHRKKIRNIKEHREKGVYDYRKALHMQLYGVIESTAWNKLYKRRVWEQLRYREGQNFEDIDIILPLLEKTDTICILDDVLVMHRIRKGSITTTLSCKNLRDRFFAHNHLIDFIQSHIPEYFKDYHLRVANEQFYASLLRDYYCFMFYRIPGRRKYFSLLQKEITYIRKRINIRDCSRKVRVSDWLYSHTPHVVSGMVYWLYRPFRFLMKRVNIG